MGVQINGDTGNISATKADYSGNVTIGGTLTYEDVTNIDSVGLITARQGIKIGTGVGVAASISVDGNAEFAGIVTASTSVKVGGGVTISESGIEASGIGITCANINGGAVSGRRNMIINGDQRIAQRGTTAVLQDGTVGYRCVDRMKTDYDGSGGGNWYHAQTGTGTSITADVPTGQGFTHSSKITINTTVSQPSGTSHQHQFYTMLERQDVYHLEWATSAAKTCTLSFWVKGSITGTYGLWIAVYGSSGGSSYYYWTNYTIDSANTWEKKVITVTGPTSGGAITSTNVLGLRLEWLLGASSGYETGTLNEWTTSNTIRTASGTVYLPENSGATWYITGIQFEVGSQATAFEHRSFAEELALCQRYYYTTKSDSNGNPNSDSAGYFGTYYTGAISLGIAKFPVVMRATPTVVLYDGEANSGKFTQNGNNYFTATAGSITTHGFTSATATSNLSSTASQSISAGFTADAEI